MPFDPPLISTDEDEITDRILDGLIERLSDDDADYEPVEGDPEVALAEEIGREAAILGQTMIDMADYASAGVGTTIFGFPAYDGVAASIEVDFELTGPGTIIPAGFTVVGLNSNGDEISFAVPADLGAVEATLHATLMAGTSGDVGNGVPAGPLTVVTATTNVISVTATAASTNGADPEPSDIYLDRLTDYLSTLRPGGVNAADLASLARSVPGVYRALAVDLYDPANPSVETERTVTVFPADETGHAVEDAVATQLQAVLADTREVNFVIHVEDPTYTTLDIVADIVAEPDANPAEVKAEVTAALAGWLTGWGSTSADPQSWSETLTAKHNNVIRIIGSVPGVADIGDVTINGGTADVTLNGPAALPTPLDASTAPSSITVTVGVL